MAQVPVQTNFRTSRPTPQPRDLPAPDASGFLQPGRIMAESAQAMGDASAAATQIYAQQLEEANRVRVIEAQNAARQAALELTYDENDGFSHVRGGEVMTRFNRPLSQEYAERYNQRIDEISAGLGNDAQRRAFRESALRLAGQFTEGVMRYEAEQFEQHRMSIYEGALELGIEEAARDYSNVERLDDILADSDASIAELSSTLGGKAANEVETDQRVARGRVISAAVAKALAEEDILTAQALLNRYEDQIDAETVIRLQGPIERAAETENVIASVDYALGQASSVMGSALPVEGGSFIPAPVEYAEGDITSAFGVDRGARGTHNGVDIRLPEGTAVRAQMPGTVERVWEDGDNGKAVKVRYADGSVHGFAHLSEQNVAEGDTIRPGQVLARTGNTGRSTGPHLHWTTTVDGEKVNPLEWSPAARGRPDPSTMRISDIEDTAVEEYLRRNPDARPSQLQLVRDQARSRASVMIADFDREQRRAEEDAFMQGAREMITNGRMTDATERAVLELAPDKYSTLMTLGPTATTDPRVWLEISAMDDLATISPQELFSRFAGRVATDDWDNLATIYRSARNGANSSNGSTSGGALSDIQRLTSSAINAGIISAKSSERNEEQLLAFEQFKLDYDNRVREFEQLENNGRRATSAQKTSILDTMTIDRVMVDDWFADTETIASVLTEEQYEDAYVMVGGTRVNLRQIPLEDRQQIVAARRAAGLPITEAGIAEYWLRAGNNPQDEEEDTSPTWFRLRREN